MGVGPAKGNGIFFPAALCRDGHAFRVISNPGIPFVVLSIAAQVLSYAGRGYLFSTVVRLAARRIFIVDGAAHDGRWE